MALDHAANQEQWRIIPDCRGLYEASDAGNIRRVGRQTPLKLGFATNGYRNVTLCIGGQRKMHSVHRLVAKAWLADYRQDLDVCHLDHNRQNNHIENLYMGTRSENLRQSVTEGRPVGQGTKGKRSHNSKLTWEQVETIRRLCSERTYDQKAIGLLYGVTQAAISRIHLRKTYKSNDHHRHHLLS